MEVGLGDKKIAQIHGSERANIMRLLGYEKAAEPAQIRLDRKLIDLS